MIPEKFRNARLVQVGDKFNPHILELCQEYVKNWRDYFQYGHGIVLAGATGLGKSYAVAATVLAIEKNYPNQYIDYMWFSSAYTMQEMLDARHFGSKERYMEMWVKATSSPILVVDDLLHVSEFQQAKQLMMSIYEKRDQSELPTLTTMNGTFSRDDFGQVSKTFNEPFARKLLDNCSGNILSA